MAKHTDGPWEILDKRVEPDKIEVVQQELPGKFVATIAPQYAPCAEGGDYGASIQPDEPTQLANAALIAAAPDLLEYAKAQERKDGGLRNPWGHNCHWCGECNGKLGMLRRAAIAEAEE